MSKIGQLEKNHTNPISSMSSIFPIFQLYLGKSPILLCHPVKLRKLPRAIRDKTGLRNKKQNKNRKKIITVFFYI